MLFLAPRPAFLDASWITVIQLGRSKLINRCSTSNRKVIQLPNWKLNNCCSTFDSRCKPPKCRWSPTWKVIQFSLRREMVSPAPRPALWDASWITVIQPWRSKLINICSTSAIKVIQLPSWKLNDCCSTFDLRSKLNNSMSLIQLWRSKLNNSYSTFEWEVE